MPQVDLESLVCGTAGTGDRKVSCETVIAGGSGDASPRWAPPPPPHPDHDFPPESITIRIGDDDGAAFSELNPIYERDDSTKGSTNPKFGGGASSNPVPLKARSNSARIAAGAAPAAATTTFFGLPVKIRPAFTRRQPSQGRILPDKQRSGGGTGEEPRSPKVSCIGKVLSDRERYGRRRQRRWWHGVAAVFRCSGGCQGVGGAGKKMALEEDGYDGEEEPSVAAMRRFKSGRRADTWAQEALAAASGETTPEEQKKHDETEHWVRLPVS